jgi:hypothetical protein
VNDNDTFDPENLKLQPGDMERLTVARKTRRSPPIRVLAPGSPVLLAGEIRATVMAISVREGPHVAYQVVWWSGLDRHEEWVYAAEVERVDASRDVKLGF